MERFLRLGLLVSGGLALVSCVDRYTPNVPPVEQTNLVVDGFINPQGRSVIKLGRTFSVNTKSTAPAETRAQVVIQDDAGRRYPLVESPAGTYSSAALVLDANRQYQVRITTAQGRDYASTPEPVVLTPPIDTLTWQVTAQGGAQTYLGTHNTSTASRYYRWDHEYTYKFYTLSFPPQGGEVCWRTEYSTTFVQGNATQFIDNALVAFPVLKISPGIELKYGYSLLVRQYAQTQAEYTYWERLLKSTENLGTVNDPLPSRLTGNVHALADASEPVLGYVGAHSVTEKRLYIDGTQFPTPRPESIYFDPAYASCSGPTPECITCILRGTKIKPSFWP
jgi:hypothetical protein